eukprot:2092064-Prorocentrum_lima.AAC.1
MEVHRGRWHGLEDENFETLKDVVFPEKGGSESSSKESTMICCDCEYQITLDERKWWTEAHRAKKEP